jgi:TP901 family phage tail tape measure protein
MADGDLIALRVRLTGGAEVKAEAESVNESIASTGATTEAASAKTKKATSSMVKSFTSIKSAGKALSTYVSLPIAGISIAAGAFALDFDRSMRNVNSIAQLPEKRFDNLKQQVLDLAGPTAQAPKTLAEGLYELVSSGFDVNEALIILKASAYGASAGLTKTNVSTKAVAAALNSYHLEASEASKVSDTLFETVNRGVITYEELAQGIGNVLPFAAAAGVSLNEVGGGISTLTKEGIPGATAMTDLKNVFVAFDKPSVALAEAIDKTKYASAEALIKHKGLQGALEEVIGTTNGSNAAVSKLFPNIRATGAAFGLTGRNMKTAEADQRAFNDTAGATAKVLKEQEKSFSFKLQRAWSEMQVVLIELGEKLLPIVVPFMLELAEGVGKAVDWFSKLSPPLQHVGLGFIVLAAVAGPVLWVIGALIPVVTGLATALLFLATNPVSLTILAIAAMAAGFYYAYHQFKPFHDAVDSVVHALGGLGNTIAYFLHFISPVGALIVLVVTHFNWLKNAVNNVGHFFSALPGRIMAAVHQLPRLIGRAVAGMIVFVATLPIRIPILVTQMGIKLVQALIGIAPQAAHAAARIAVSIAHGIASKAPAIWGWVKTLPGKFASAVSTVAGALASVGGQIASEIANGLKNKLSSLLPGPIKDALNAAKGVAGEVGGFLGFASGTSFAPGGVALVGERGPELVNLPRGSEVLTAHRTRSVFSQTTETTIPAPRRREVMDEAGRAHAVPNRGGGGRPLIVRVPLEVDGRVLAEVVKEVEDDDKARLGY